VAIGANQNGAVGCLAVVAAPITIPEIELLEELGGSAHSVVYRARRQGRVFALKVPRDSREVFQRAALLKRFRREAVALARVRHPALPDVIELGEAETTPYLLMEVVNGEPLDRRLERGPLTQPQALELARQLADALVSIHRCGLVHRNLKPCNIVFESEGSRVRLIDFGVDDERDVDVSALGAIASRPYSAPEQSAGNEHVDGRADLFSLGSVFYECLTGSSLFSEISSRGMVRQNARLLAPLLARAAPEIDPAVCRLVARLVAGNPDDRYPCAEALLVDIERLQRGEAPERILQTSPSWLPAPAQSLASTALIGRAQDLELLREVWSDAVEGHGRVVVLSGTPGIGKSRLAAELLGELRSKEVAVLWASCDASDLKPFSAIRQFLEGYVRAHRHGPSGRVREAENHLRALAGDFAPLIRVLSPLLSEVFDDAHPMPSSDEAHTFFVEGLAEFVGRLVRDIGPAVVFVDNAHWLDAGSRRVLARLTDHLATSPCLLLFALRHDSGSKQVINGLQRGLETHRLAIFELQPLEQYHIAELARAYLGGGELNEEAVRYLESFADRAPLSVLELLRAMVENGALSWCQGRWKLDREAIASLRLPSQTAALIAHRIEAMPRTTLETLAVGAVLGSSFEDHLLTSVSELPEEQTRTALADARSAWLIESQAPGSHRFVHDVVHEALLEKLSAERQKAIHQRIAEKLDADARFRTEPAVDTKQSAAVDMDYCYLLATHYALGDVHTNPRRVFETNLLAGQFAFRSFDNERALAFFEAALRAQAWLAGRPEPELEFAIAEARFRTGALEESLRLFQNLLDTTKEPILRAKAYSRISKIREVAFDTDQAWKSLEPAFRALRSPYPTSSLMALLRSFLTWVRWACLPFGRRAGPVERHRIEVLLSLYDQAGRLASHCATPLIALTATFASLGLAERLGPSAAQAISYPRYALLLVLLGFKSKGLDYLARASAVAESIHDPALQAYLLQTSSVLLAHAGDVKGGIRAGAKLLEEQGHWRDLIEYCLMACNQQLLESGRGRSRVAAYWVRRAVQRLAQHEGAAIVPEFVALRARAALVGVGHDVEAQSMMERLREVTVPTPPGSALTSLIHGPRVAFFAESGRLGEEFEAVVQEVESAALNPARVHLAMAEYYIHVAQARVHQCLRASRDDRARFLPQLRKASSDLGKAARVPLIRAHHRAVRGYLKWFSGKTCDSVERDFTEAERLGREQGAPWVLYCVHRGRAHMLKARGEIESARDEARMAEAVARAHGSAYRLRWIREEFELGPADHAILPESALPSHDPAMTPGSGLPHTSGQLHSVLHVMRAHHSDLDPERQARTIVDELVRVLRAERGFLYLTPASKSDAKSTPNAPPTLDFVAGRDDRQRDVIGANIDHEFLQQCLRRKAAYVLQPTSKEPSSRGTGTVRYSSLASPLVLEDRVVGVVRLDRRVGLGEFTEEDAELLSGLACQVPLALELMQSLNARGRLEEQERTTQKMEAVARMAGGIAHDFNNMLSAIRTSAEAILADNELRPGVIEDVRTIQGAAERAEELTRQLLTFSRGQHLDAEVLLLQGLIERATPVLRKLAGPGIELKVSLEPDLHPVKVDRSHLDRTLANLVTNARDAMEHGGSITIWARNVTLSEQDSRQLSGISPGQYVLLSVSDTGHGIEPSIRDKIFDPFFTTKATQGGSGLGLATTYGIVRQSGGAIDVESEPGRGTTFKIYLPRTMEPFKVEVPRTHSVRPSQGGETLLFVEDEPLVNQSMCRLLRRKGYRVVSARGGNEALELANQHASAVDLLITDVMMPDMNGIELARELRKSKPGLKVLYTSGYSADVVGDVNIWGNRVEFLQKPVPPNVLIDRVRQMLEEGPA
jgi:signal transduction histidine kinase/predicted Ser/Thr protein kinase